MLLKRMETVTLSLMDSSVWKWITVGGDDLTKCYSWRKAEKKDGNNVRSLKDILMQKIVMPSSLKEHFLWDEYLCHHQRLHAENFRPSLFLIKLSKPFCVEGH
jgi:hypothetical protein